VSEHPEVETVGRVLEMAARYGLEELDIEEGALRISVRAWPHGEGAEGLPGEGSRYLWTPPAWPEPAANARPETAHAVTAPLTGTFYRSPSPDQPAFVEVGDAVEEGQVIGLIEAMKVFSEIAADRAGRVLEFATPNGKLVQHGDPLLYIDTAG
jgi:acetyl-CoA carboxylase biotin carboxyl carrier protein